MHTVRLLNSFTEILLNQPQIIPIQSPTNNNALTQDKISKIVQSIKNLNLIKTNSAALPRVNVNPMPSPEPQRVNKNPLTTQKPNQICLDDSFEQLLKQNVRVPPKIVQGSSFPKINLGGLSLPQLHPKWLAYHIFNNQG